MKRDDFASYESWLKREKEEINSHFGKEHFIYSVIGLLLLLYMFVMCLDGVAAVEVVTAIFSGSVIFILIFMQHYKTRYISPLMRTIKKELDSEEARQEFGREMSVKSVFLHYMPLPQKRSWDQHCEMRIAEQYCYVRQPLKLRIIRNSKICKVLLTREKYLTNGEPHPYFRRTYRLALYTTDNDKKPAWKGYFDSKEELYQAFEKLSPVLPQKTEVSDDLPFDIDGDEFLYSRELKLIIILIVVILLGWVILNLSINN